MNSKNRWLIAIASIIALFYLGSFGFSAYNKLMKENWLAEIDLTSLLIQKNDLPPGYYPGNTRNLEPNDYYEFSQGKEQDILAPNGSQAGFVRAYLFSNKGDQVKMYNLLSLMETPEGIISLDVENVGEMQLAAADPFGLIIFTRCTGIGYLHIKKDELSKGYDTDMLISHAKRLDKELETISCKNP